MSVADLTMTVADRVVVAAGVLCLALEPVDGADLPAWEPGAHVDLVLSHELVRQYSLCGDPADRQRWEVAVLREPAGKGGSVFVHDRLAVGDRVRVRGPRNHFRLEPAAGYRFIAGGIGITPLVPMLAAAAAAGAQWQLVYGGRTRTSMAFADRLAASYPGQVTVVPQDVLGMLDLVSLLEVPSPGTLVYCCGPGPLLDAVAEQMKRWPPGSLHLERFTATPGAPGATATARGKATFEVELALSGRAVTVEPHESVLQAVERSGVVVLSSCREGICGTCETAVLDGTPEHLDHLLTNEEQAANDCMMICVSRSLTPRLVLEL